MRRSLGVFFVAVFVSAIGFSTDEKIPPKGAYSWDASYRLKESLAFSFDDLIKKIEQRNDVVIRTVLQVLAENEEYDRIDTLLNKSVTSQGLSPLMHALVVMPPSKIHEHVFFDIVRTLLGSGTNPNLPLETNFKSKRGGSFYPGWTAFHVAVRMRLSAQILEKLRQHKGDFLRKDDDGWSPIELAFYETNHVAINYFKNLPQFLDTNLDFEKCLHRGKSSQRAKCRAAKERWLKVQKEALARQNQTSHYDDDSEGENVDEHLFDDENDSYDWAADPNNFGHHVIAHAIHSEPVSQQDDNGVSIDELDSKKDSAVLDDMKDLVSHVQQGNTLLRWPVVLPIFFGAACTLCYVMSW